jgi:hypothetical protein
VSHGNQTQSPIDPQAPFIASDGLEYEDLAACILGTPLGCPRNEHILAHRRAGRSEEAIRIWIKAYDGEDTTPSVVLRQRANEAKSSLEALTFAAGLARRHSRATRAYSFDADVGY